MVVFYINHSRHKVANKIISRFLKHISGISEYEKKTIKELLELYEKSPLNKKNMIAYVICEKMIDNYRKEKDKEGLKNEYIGIIYKFLKEKKECAKEYEVLIELGDEDVIEEIVKRWEFVEEINPRSREKINIINALGEIGGEKSEKFLLYIAKNEKNLFGQERAIENLKKILKEKEIKSDEIKDTETYVEIEEIEREVEFKIKKLGRLMLSFTLLRNLFIPIYLFFLLPILLKLSSTSFILKRNGYNLLLFSLGTLTFVYITLGNIGYFIVEKDKRYLYHNWEIILISIGFIIFSLILKTNF